MNPHVAPGCRQVAFALALLALLGGQGHGQSVSPPISSPPRAASTPVPTASQVASKDEAVELSPFVVRGESGWIATETLMGTRLRTDLRDVPSQIETFTKDFMDDLAMNSVEEALIYSVNSENQTEFVVANAETPAFYTNSTNRVRGMNAGTYSTNLFKSMIAPDNYNVESASVASGPNSTLFGMGGASGTFDNSISRATMTNKYGVRFQYSSEDSRRVSLDLNRVLLKNRLSLRLMALWKDEQTHAKPNYDKDTRLTAALTYKPLKHTTLRVRYEHVDRDQNRAPRALPYDYLTPWLYANQMPGSPYTSAKPAYDNRTALPTNLSATTRIFGAHSAAPVFIASSPNSPVMNWARSVQVLSPSAATLYGVPDASFDTASRVTFRDSSVVPTNLNAYGNLKSTWLGGRSAAVSVEQRLAPNLFLELAANLENSHEIVLGMRGQGVAGFYADANSYLPASLSGSTTVLSNPDFGRYYMENAFNHNVREFAFRDYRATLSYELDLTRQSNRWLRWLGRHRPVLFADTGDTRTRTQLNFSPRILDNPNIPGLTLTPQTANNWAANATRGIIIRSYLDQNLHPASMPNALDSNFPYVDGTGQVFTATNALVSGLTLPNGKRLANSNAGLNGTWSQTDTWLLAYQGQFLQDRRGSPRLILTYGYREDRARSAQADLASRTQDAGAGRTGFYPYYEDASRDPYGAAQTGVTRTKGAVLRPLPWLSLIYNESSTFDVSTEFFGPTGNRYPGTGGAGKDYGVRLDLWSNRVSLRVNKYENSAGPSRAAGTLDDPFRGPTNALELRVRELDPSTASPANWFSAPLNFGYNAYHLFSYKVAEGYEVSLDLQPTRNWSIRINAAKGEGKESKIGEDWVAWLQARLAVWQSVVAKNGEVDASGRPLTWATADIDPASSTENRTLKQYYEEQVAGSSLAMILASDGRVSDGSRAKRANIVTNYRFTEGRFKGVSVGGALRWRPAPVIGYPVMTNSYGTKMLNLERGYYGKAEFPVDLFTTYRGRLKYFGGVGYSVQLNIRNALDQSDPIPVGAYTNGGVYRYAMVEPRLFIVSCGFDF